MSVAQTVNEEEKWLILRKYFEKIGLVRQHLDSFNEFLENTLQQICDETKKIVPDIPDFYMQFDADDSVIYASPPGTRIAIVVEYLDQGTDSFSIQYDAHSGGPFGDGRFKDTGPVLKTDSGEFRTVTFWLDDVYFANRDNGADFRIDDHGNGAETIRRVTVRSMGMCCP